MKRNILIFIILCFTEVAGAVPPYDKTDMQSLLTAIKVACPQAVGVDSNGNVSFENATPSCQNAANIVAQTFNPPPSIPTSLQINSITNSAINGAYAFDAITQSKVMAISLYIQINGKFPAKYTTLPFPDANGTMHNFTSTTQFQAFATALADYATALTLGQTPSTPVTIP